MAKTLHFKSPGAYQRWLAYAQMHGKTHHHGGEGTPKIMIAGKVHHVSHNNPAELVIFGNPSRNGSGSYDEMLRRLRDTYNGYLRQGWTKSQAVKQTLRESTAGSKVKQDFLTEAGMKNPRGRRNAGASSTGGAPNHKPSCTCPICKNMRAAAGRLPNRRRSAKRRRNQEGGEGDLTQAVELYQTFHGKDPAGVIEKQVSAAMRTDYTALGDLDYLIVQPDGAAEVKIDFGGDGVKLAAAPEGTQLYLIGGKQTLNDAALAQFTDDTSEDLFDLGEAKEVQYVARKAPEFDTVKYFHKFGEEARGSEMPRAFYDAIRKQIFLAGGEYHVEAPGIIN